MTEEEKEVLHARREIFIARRFKLMAVYHAIEIKLGKDDPMLPTRIRVGKICKLLCDRIEILRQKMYGEKTVNERIAKLRKKKGGKVHPLLEERFAARRDPNCQLPVYLIGNYVLKELPIEDIHTKYRKHRRLKVYALKGLACTHPGCVRVASRLLQTMDVSGSVHLDLFTHDLKHMNVDHILPKSQGGGEEITNKQPMCAYHNSRKGNKIPKEHGDHKNLLHNTEAEVLC